MNNALPLMAAYIVVVVFGQAAGAGLSYLTGMAVPTFGLPVFLFVFLGMFWLAWPISVWLTRPRAAVQPVAVKARI